MTSTKEEALSLEYVSYIYYLVQFKKDINESQL